MSGNVVKMVIISLFLWGCGGGFSTADEQVLGGDGDFGLGGSLVDGDVPGDGDGDGDRIPPGSGGGSGGTPSLTGGGGGSLPDNTGGASLGTGGGPVECDVPESLLLPETGTWEISTSEFTCAGSVCAGNFYFAYDDIELVANYPDGRLTYELRMSYATDVISLDAESVTNAQTCSYEKIWGEKQYRRIFTIDLLPVEGGFVVSYDWPQMSAMSPMEASLNTDCYMAGGAGHFQIALNEHAANFVLGSFVPCQ